MKLKPLDLEGLKKWVKQDLAVKEGNIDRAIDLTINKIKQRIEQACEFYLRYKDKPELLWQERPELREKFDEFSEQFDGRWEKMQADLDKSFLTEEDLRNYKHDKFMEEYNEWLFKLTFKGVFGGGGND